MVTPIRCHDLDLADILHDLSATTSTFPMKYLGLPLTIKRLKRIHFQHFEDKAAGKLVPWTGKFFNISGCVPLGGNGKPLQQERQIVGIVLFAIKLPSWRHNFFSDVGTPLEFGTWLKGGLAFTHSTLWIGRPSMTSEHGGPTWSLPTLGEENRSPPSSCWCLGSYGPSATRGPSRTRELCTQSCSSESNRRRPLGFSRVQNIWVIFYQESIALLYL